MVLNDSEADKIAADYVRRQRLSPLEINNRELRDGLRWTLLQAIAWVATESKGHVALIAEQEKQVDALKPDPDASRKVGLELGRLLRTLSAPALSFAAAQTKLFKLLSEGEVTVYVDHQEFVPAGIRFTNLTYRADFTGLAPAPDDRYWGYVVVDAESLMAAVATSRSASADRLAIAGEEARLDDEAAQIAWYRKRVATAESHGFRWTRDEDQEAGARVGLGVKVVRHLRSQYASHWAEGSKPSTEQRARKAAFLATRD